MSRLQTNRVLAALPDDRLAALEPKLTLQRMDAWDLIREEQSPIARVYFPTTAIISIVSLMEDGTVVESYTVGSDGAAGAELLLGVDRLGHRSMCQVPGEMYWMDARDFLSMVERDAVFDAVVRRYLHCMLSLTGQAAACNLVHELAARCARWLLTVQNRVGSDEFELTHDILATMLGVHRPAVTLAAGTLQRAGLISYSRGHVRVVDRENLLRASCECFRIIEDEFDRVFGPR